MERVVDGDVGARRLVDSSHVKLKHLAVIVVVLCKSDQSLSVMDCALCNRQLTDPLQVDVGVYHFVKQRFH